MSEPNQRGKERPRSSILDFNSSWPLMIVYIGYLVGIYFAQRSTFGMFNLDNTYAYFLIPLICGLVVTFFVYNGFKILFARIAGYRLRYIRILGFFFDFSGEKMKTSYDILTFFDVFMRFSPKDDDLTKNPRKIFWGGSIGELVLLAVALVVYFTTSFGKTGGSAIYGWSILFAVVYGFVMVLYELVPLRQDYATDAFNLLKTKTKEEQEAFNLICANKRREMQGLPFLVPETKDFDSYYPAQTLYYLYLDNLYASRLEQALRNLEDMKYYAVDFPEDERYVAPGEYIYLRYLIDDEQGADAMYLSQKNDDKLMIRKPTTLANYRSALFVAANVQKSKEKVMEIVKAHDQLVSSYPQTSDRVEKEKALFEEVYRKIQKAHPDLDLEDRASK